MPHPGIGRHWGTKARPLASMRKTAKDSCISRAPHGPAEASQVTELSSVLLCPILLPSFPPSQRLFLVSVSRGTPRRRLSNHNFPVSRLTSWNTGWVKPVLSLSKYLTGWNIDTTQKHTRYRRTGVASSSTGFRRALRGSEAYTHFWQNEKGGEWSNYPRQMQ